VRKIAIVLTSIDAVSPLMIRTIDSVAQRQSVALLNYVVMRMGMVMVEGLTVLGVIVRMITR
jgi:hypothetical protein